MATLPGQIYTGSWTNWSKGSVLGSTITISAEQGLFLTAFLAIWITWTGAHLWGIICFAIIQLQSTDEPRDGLHHQKQAVLRNSGAPGDALWNLTKVTWAWRRTSIKPFKRTISPLLMALLHITAFAVAGIFSSRVSQNGAEVLLAPGICGWVADDRNPYVIYRATARESVTYAQSCYLAGEADTSDNDDGKEQDRSCRQFARSQIGNRTIDTAAPCPFNSTMCSAPSALRLDTGYISSVHDLGINTPQREQLWFRKSISVSPINLDGRMGPLILNPDSDTLGYNEYFLGNLIYKGETYNWTFQVPNSYQAAIVARYSIVPYPAYLNNTDLSFYIPIPELNRTDADVMMFEILNYVDYGEPVNDPLYRSNDTMNGDQSYSPLSRVAVLAATEQYQYCTAPSESSCSPLNGLFNQDLSSLDLTPNQLALANHIGYLQVQSSLYQVTTYLGPQSIITPDYLVFAASGLSEPLPDNQWQIDSENIHNASLAMMQRLAVDWASHSPTPLFPGAGDRFSVANAVQRPNDTETARLCDMQKVRSYAYFSFSSLGIGLIFGVGGLIMIINCCLSEVVQCVRIRRGRKLDKSHEWTETEFLHLQRLALEGRGIGPWEGAQSAVPVPMVADQNWSAAAERWSEGKDVEERPERGREGGYRSVAKGESG